MQPDARNQVVPPGDYHFNYQISDCVPNSGSAGRRSGLKQITVTVEPDDRRQ